MTEHPLRAGHSSQREGRMAVAGSLPLRDKHEGKERAIDANNATSETIYVRKELHRVRPQRHCDSGLGVQDKSLLRVTS